MRSAGGRSATLASPSRARPEAAAGMSGLFAGLAPRFLAALESELDQRRFFLWLPVCAGAGALLYLSADREPLLWAPAGGFAVFGTCAVAARRTLWSFLALVAVAAVFAGFLSAGWRAARVDAPVLDRTRILRVSGYVEQVDPRREGARFVLRVAGMDGVEAADTPRRVRLTTRRTPGFEAGAFVSLTARLLPPARPSLPGGYDFARDAWFAQIGAVGTALGRIETATASAPPGAMLAGAMAIDRFRNALARSVYTTVGGDIGAVGAAMVTGKRDFLSEDAKTLIREAGIFHIITISGVQMTLVAGILFGLARLLLALHPTLRLRYPVKKWAAAAAIVGAIGYDILTGSRVGTERALFMTGVMLFAVIVDRQALTMRNLAWAALLVIALEPEALLGASFQLSFAAVAALVAVYEGRMARRSLATAPDPFVGSQPRARLGHGIYGPGAAGRFGRKILQALVATACATAATASFMAYNFHEISPYVLIGNPLTLAIIEFFAVPGALLGALLYPFGLDGWVWNWLALGIRLVFWLAAHIASAPGATVHVREFAPGAILFLAAAVLFAVLWRTTLLRLTAVPLAAVGLVLAASGERFDVLVSPGGEAAAFRTADGSLATLSPRPNVFQTEQWLRADADGRTATQAGGARCDRLGCTGTLADGRSIALVLERAAFEEDCRRAAIIVTPLWTPEYCTAPIILDRRRLAATGAVRLRLDGDAPSIRTDRTPFAERPWSRLPRNASPSSWAETRTPAEPSPQKSRDEEDAEALDLLLPD